MTKVKVRNGESLEQALRRFNKATAGIIKELNKRKHYRKPSEIKAEKMKEKARKIWLENKRIK